MRPSLKLHRISVRTFGIRSAIRLDVRVEAPHLRRHRLVACLCHGQALGGEAQALLLVGLVDSAGFVFLAAVVLNFFALIFDFVKAEGGGGAF